MSSRTHGGLTEEQIYLAALSGNFSPFSDGRYDGILAVTAASAAGVPVPSGLPQPSPNARAVAEALILPRPSILALHLGAVIMNGQGLTLRGAGRATTRTAATASMLAGEGIQAVANTVPDKYRLLALPVKVFGKAFLALGVLGEMATDRHSKPLFVAARRLVAREYGQHVNVPSILGAGLTGILLKRLVKATGVPDRSLIRVADYYLNCYDNALGATGGARAIPNGLNAMRRRLILRGSQISKMVAILDALPPGKKLSATDRNVEKLIAYFIRRAVDPAVLPSGEHSI